MRLTREASQILGKTTIGMLALRSRRLPLVNPAVFSFAGGSLWMTTSRYAAKTIMAKRDPRAAFLVDGGSEAVLLRGALEVFDPLNVTSQVRAMLEGPGYFLGMAGYALRNAPFVAGYALDLARLPREWMPYNRVVLRLKLSDADLVEGAPFPQAQAARVLGGRSWAGEHRADERPPAQRVTGRPGRRVAPPLPPVADGRCMHPRHVRSFDRR